MTARDEWKQSWQIALACTLGLAAQATPAYSIGVFMPLLQGEFGWSRAQIAGAMSITSIVSGPCTVLVGYASDRYGARKLVLLGVLTLCCAVASLSLVTNIQSYWFHWGLIGATMALTSAVLWTRPLVERFTQSRGLALAVAMCGSNITGALTPPLLAGLTLHFNWRESYMMLGACMFLVATPMAFIFFRDATPKLDTASASSEPVRVGASVREAFRSRRFWLMAVAFMLGGGCVTSLVIHVVPMMRERGLTPMTAAATLSVFSVAALAGRVGCGYLLDRVHAPLVAGVSFMLPTLACAGLLISSDTVALPYIAAGFFGLALGAEYDLMAFMTSRYFGLRSYGTLFGLMVGMYAVGTATIPPTFGYISEWSGGYDNVLIFLIGAFLISATALQFLGRYPEWTPAATPETM